MAIPTSVVAQVRQEIRGLDPDLPVYRLRTMDERVSESLARRRFAMLLLTLLRRWRSDLRSIGVYGVMAYLVSQGTRELGIRLALGATPRSILTLIISRGMAVTAAGLTAGLAAALALTGFMRSLLFQVEPSDPLTFVAIPVVLGAAAFAATSLARAESCTNRPPSDNERQLATTKYQYLWRFRPILFSMKPVAYAVVQQQFLALVSPPNRLGKRRSRQPDPRDLRRRRRPLPVPRRRRN